MGRFKTKSDYDKIRKARIVENQERLANLGLQKTLSEQRSLNSSKRSKPRKIDYTAILGRRSSARLSGESPPTKDGKLFVWEGRKKLSELEERRRVSDPTYGIACHFCRQRKLCCEEDCKRCGDRDWDLPCIGKTDCSVCHSDTGIFCRGCLKRRYGEELEEVRMNEEWMCPHCIEEKGTKPYWICNSNSCLKEKNLAPLGVGIFEARELGFKSVAHMLMDVLSKIC